MITPAEVSANVERIHQRIADSGGDPTAIEIVAVTKAFDAPVAAAALEAGLVDLGENYAQQMLAKIEDFDENPPVVAPRWHFIGGLQRKKVRKIAGHVSCYQTIDRLSLAEEVARRDPRARILVQVNATGELQKGGCAPGEVADLVRAASDLGLDLVGLMGVGKEADDATTTKAFRELSDLADRHELAVRSMGMSTDLELAVAAGTTMVRIGSDLFGRRPE